MGKIYKYIYGPVPSWRIGRSLGVDPISQNEKICTFDCIYCQLGKKETLIGERKAFVSNTDVIDELKSLPPLKIDYVTFSGTGEPTLAKNLGEMIRGVRGIRKEKIAVLTNSSLMHRDSVIKDLCLADLVVARLDAPSQGIFELVNQPAKNIRIDAVIRSIKDFRRCYKGRLALQIMFMKENKNYAKEIAWIAEEINPDEVQLNTPLRPYGVKPLTKSEMIALERYFSRLNVVSVYKAKKKTVKPISSGNTLKRRGKI